MSPVLVSGAPFFTGLTTSSEVPGKYPVGLAGHGYNLDLKKYRRRTLPSLRPPSDSQVEPGEQSLNTEGYWRRTQSDWSLGAGQEFFDNEDSSRRRFYTSKGVDPWTRDRLSLHFDTALREASIDTNLKTLAVSTGLYFVEGSALKYGADPTAGVGTTVTSTGLGAITGLATNGATIYVTDGVKVMSGAVGGASVTDLTTEDVDLLFFCNGRLIGFDANEAFEIPASGTVGTHIKDHDNTSFVWSCALGASNGIYIAGNSGDRNEVYYLGINTSTGALLSPVFAMNLPFGETLNCIEQYGKIVVLGTSKGFRLATIGDDNGLYHGPLVAITGGVKDFDFQGQYAWFTYTNYDATSTGLGRINLAEFTEPLVPAYATDLMATVQGTVQSVSTFADKRYFAVSGSGLWGQATTRVASGIVTSGWVRFSTVENKVVSSIEMRHEPLAGSALVTVEADDGTTTDAVTSPNALSLGPPEPLSLGQFSAEMFRTALTLARSASDTTTGPTFRRWTVRAIATPFRTEEIVAPIIMESAVELAEGIDDNYDTLAEFMFLKDLENSRQIVRYQEGISVYSVYVDGVELQPESWTFGNRFFNGVIFVRLLTVESTTA